MPDKRHHRGPHPEDARLFAPEAWPALRSAVAELSWLLTRGYAQPSALKLVGDRYNLTVRQRTAVMRCSCTDAARAARLAREVKPDELSGRAVFLDGYNVLTSVEAALAGAVVLVGRDTCWRDMSSMHGHYHSVEETRPALALCGRTLRAAGAGPCTWYLDQPVSNSGRLAKIMRAVADSDGWDWQVQIVPSPDALLGACGELVATADSAVLDRCGPWVNLPRRVMSEDVATVNIVDLCASIDPVRLQ
jgi:hypothetical protein